MKGVCSLIICHICDKEMSFGRLKSHIKARHKEIILNNYINQYYKTLPLHHLCVICNKNVVYKYQTCSKECHNILRVNKLKGVPKPKGFMNQDHKNKLSKSRLGGIGGFTNHSHSKETIEKIRSTHKGLKHHLGYKHSDYTKQIMSQKKKKWYAKGNEPWSKTHTHTPETIEKIFKKKKSNKLEKLFSELLDYNNISYKFQFFLKNNKICKSYDFYLKDRNLLIEIDGDYWHGNPSTKSHFFDVEKTKQNDIFKSQFAQDNGFKILRFWESDIKSNPTQIIDQIKNIK